MVLQQNSVCMLWGTSAPNTYLHIRYSWEPNSHKVLSEESGCWQSEVSTLKAGGPYKITIKSKNDCIEIKNILIGEVWLCSGQSNMQLPLMGWETAPVKNSKREIANAEYPQIRMFNVQCNIATEPQQNFDGKWTVCSPNGAKWFSAVGYFFAKELHHQLKCPIGMINSSMGDTPIQAWMSNKSLKSCQAGRKTLAEFKEAIKNYKTERKTYEKRLQQWQQNGQKPSTKPFKPIHESHSRRPSGRYNAMIAPALKYKIKGVIWYQGENNRSQAKEYNNLFPAMIKSWRSEFGLKDIPFYYAQLTAFYKHCPNTDVVIEPEKPKNEDWPQLRQAQLETMKVNNTGMAVTIDIGSKNNIHPPDKETVGKRLAAWAFANDYNQNIPFCGPLYYHKENKGSKIRIYFKNATGLHSTGNGNIFAVAGEDNVYRWAEFEIQDDTVIVWNDSIEKPVNVRFSWMNYPEIYIYNSYSLPMSPFTTEKLF
ncbi:MAG: sialate O-acetylesterase [Sedimentisphaeraceae bacterium JB056]